MRLHRISSELPPAKLCVNFCRRNTSLSERSHLLITVQPALLIRSLFVIPLALLTLTSAQARLGETLEQLKIRYGKPEQQQQPRKDVAVWLFEVEDGQLIYNVTFECQRPVDRRRACVRSNARSSHQRYCAGFHPGTNRTVPQFEDPAHSQTRGKIQIDLPDRCSRAGEPGQLTVVDDVNGVMIIWTQKGVPSTSWP